LPLEGAPIGAGLLLPRFALAFHLRPQLSKIVLQLLGSHLQQVDAVIELKKLNGRRYRPLCPSTGKLSLQPAQLIVEPCPFGQQCLFSFVVSHGDCFLRLLRILRWLQREPEGLIRYFVTPPNPKGGQTRQTLRGNVTKNTKKTRKAVGCLLRGTSGVTKKG
jgi:hypothetical protein